MRLLATADLAAEWQTSVQPFQERPLISSSLLPRLTAASRALQRVLLVALCLIPVILVTLASLPALAVLPFTEGGAQRSIQVVRQLASWTFRTLTASRP